MRSWARECLGFGVASQVSSKAIWRSQIAAATQYLETAKRRAFLEGEGTLYVGHFSGYWVAYVITYYMSYSQDFSYNIYSSEMSSCYRNLFVAIHYQATKGTPMPGY